MAFTQADLDVLDSAIANNELSVEFNGRKIVFGNFKELKARRDFIKEEMAKDSGGGGRAQQVCIRVSKGV